MVTATLLYTPLQPHSVTATLRSPGRGPSDPLQPWTYIGPWLQPHSVTATLHTPLQPHSVIATLRSPGRGPSDPLQPWTYIGPWLQPHSGHPARDGAISERRCSYQSRVLPAIRHTGRVGLQINKRTNEKTSRPRQVEAVGRLGLWVRRDRLVCRGTLVRFCFGTLRKLRLMDTAKLTKRQSGSHRCPSECRLKSFWW